MSYLKKQSKSALSLFTALALLFTLSSTSSLHAETTSPTPAPTTTVSATPSATASPAATKKPVKKPAKKKVVKKKRISLTPAPSPAWPPKGFTVKDDVYAKVPSKLSEIVGVISTQPYLAKQVKNCERFICGYVQVASVSGCLWWEAFSTIVAGDGRKVGDLKTAHGSSNPREIRTFIIVSPELLAGRTRSVLTSVICHRASRDTKNPSVDYMRVETSTTTTS